MEEVIKTKPKKKIKTIKRLDTKFFEEFKTMETLYKEYDNTLKHIKFIDESNRIEGINRPATTDEIAECNRFLRLKKIQIADLVKFVKIYQPNALLRNRSGLDVRIGDYYPPAGHISIEKWLLSLLKDIQEPALGLRALSAYEAHRKYEKLHPFTDCNGRSGRMLWYWIMKGKAPLGFLHTYYYQSLAHHHS